MIGPACIVRSRIATPAAQSVAVAFTISAERVQADEVDRAAAHLHPHGERDHGQQRRDHQPADEARDRVAEHDPAAVRRGEQQPAREARLEVARDPEAR